ncbi:12525_t:CDS:2 [Ambispora leptoticha]|uniref:12525_t:CDS:1 n=1 Tax=Ambispora leptoticha TaxID=144679 RepID=A0A9N9BUS9_9GLOM|nr:12525_t:CDS:2 [Ambispora leptoticha]
MNFQDMNRFLAFLTVILFSSMVVATPIPKLKRDSGAEGAAVGSPGVNSGNVIQIPLQVPINLCGNSIDIVGLLNAASEDSNNYRNIEK